MKAKLCVAVLAALAALVPPAAQGGDVLKDKGCLNCHDMAKKKVGPSFKDLAAKYQGKSGAVDEIAAKMQSGKGHPKVKATDDEVKAAIKQALGQ